MKLTLVVLAGNKNKAEYDHDLSIGRNSPISITLPIHRIWSECPNDAKHLAAYHVASSYRKKLIASFKTDKEFWDSFLAQTGNVRITFPDKKMGEVLLDVLSTLLEHIKDYKGKYEQILI